ncbi:MAG: radical SAM protein [Acidobacteria bacterium]|nr:MAG: radical SAM protein [Acidobacteriota bacterium]MCE7957916.1 radical SAM protein [Acidobacteria bacterium ACB2]
MPQPRSRPPADRRRALLAAERPTEAFLRGGRHRVGLGFANSYEVGMSNLGFQWVYRLLNREEDVTCERFFHDPHDPDPRGPRTLESDTPLGELPLLAFSVSWEMDYANLLALLPRARVPLLRADRGEGDPVVLVGGDCARINPVPLAPYVDVFAMGDGERLVPPLAEVLRRDLSREGTLAALASLRGFYVPALHGPRAEAAEEGRIVVQQLKPADGPGREPPHTTLLTPHTELSDKLLVEIARGCSEMCRFCWAAYAMAPQVRVPASSVLAVAERCRPLTSRAGLIATAVADHPEILPILRGLAGLGYHVALSSIKIDAVSEELLSILARQGERSLAIAPEAGNERLRRLVNKKVSDEMLRDKVRLIARAGFTNLKLYLQVGLPGETEGDVDDLVRLVDDLRGIFLEEGRRRGRVGTLVPSVNAFVPKPHTPFENEVLDDPAEIARKMSRLDAAFRRMPNVTFRGMPVAEAVWEAYLAKMGPESGEILLAAASGVPLRRLVREHGATMLAVVRPEGERPDPSRRGVFDPLSRSSSPWGFIGKS